MKKLSPRVWLTLILVGMVGQFAWTIENMYFNVYLYNTISTDPGYISAMVGWSAAAATLTTLLMGALSDRVGKRKLFICGGYLLWGLSTAAFGLVTVENAAKLFPAASAAAAAAVMIVVLDCVMTFFGSTANDAAFNAWITDTVPNARGQLFHIRHPPVIQLLRCRSISYRAQYGPRCRNRLSTRSPSRRSRFCRPGWFLRWHSSSWPRRYSPSWRL